jgi:hypothetical protein
MAIVDRVVAVPPDQLVWIVVAERRNCGRVRESDQPFRIDHPHRLRDSPQHRCEEILGADPQATKIGH